MENCGIAGFRRSVSSLSALATFEAAARLKGFTRAAEELGVTQAAVSRQIKLLEADLNTPLFLRGHRKVELTPGGSMLARALTERVFAVCAPSLAATGKPLDSLPLIGCEWIDPSWLSWKKWAQLAGLSPPPRPSARRFSQYTDAVYSAMAGEGVALGWQALVGPMLADGRLVRLGEAEVIPEEANLLLVPAARTPSRAARDFTDWLVAAFAAVQA